MGHISASSKEEILARIFKGKNITDDKKAVAENRYEFFMSLEPKKLLLEIVRSVITLELC